VVIKDFLIEHDLIEKDYLENIVKKCVDIINNELKNLGQTTLIHKDFRFINMFILPSDNGPEILVSDTAPLL
jgi:hypothetical protein